MGFNIILAKFNTLENTNFSYAVIIEENTLSGKVTIKLNVNIPNSTLALSISSALIEFANKVFAFIHINKPTIPAIIPIIV